MSAPHFAARDDVLPERGFWQRFGGSAVLIGAGLGWASALLACALAGPVSLALGSRDERRPTPHDDL
ncbi:MAG: hypothetical protein IT306_11505 [Chloroflexi bacterium]|nr:hypothetical protein [Chloroflexota bacterium]